MKWVPHSAFLAESLSHSSGVATKPKLNAWESHSLCGLVILGVYTNGLGGGTATRSSRGAGKAGVAAGAGGLFGGGGFVGGGGNSCNGAGDGAGVDINFGSAFPAETRGRCTT
mmetsp:Transcript_57514/g.117031  ORF Transcript_57514/g.117031 Transcript_57514/m.117031 type:complete len:113 (-) Transcript_57514:100-438(-)